MNKVVFRSEISPVDANKTIGPARTHLYSFVIAKRMKLDGHNVSYIIKCDDSDSKKHKKQNFYGIHAFLVSLGIKADIHPYNSEEILGCSLFQSERSEIYRKYLGQLLDSGLAFPADNSGFVVFDVEKFATDCASKIEIKDELLGELIFSVEDILREGQRVFPLRRSDGSYLFNFASVADDLELEVTHVVRGQDKIHVIPIQEMIRIALGFFSPAYIHLPLLCDEKGKRTGGYVQFDDFLKVGILEAALMSYVLSSGYGNPDEIFLSLDEFITKFNLENLHRNNTRFCAERLNNINRRVAHLLSSNQYRQAIQSYAVKSYDPKMLEIMGDADVQYFLEEFRMTPKESIDIVDRIMFPKESPPDNTLIKCIRQTIERLRSGTEFDTLCSELGYFGKDIFSKSLRWVLIRETGGIELKKIFLFLKKKGLLIERAEMATKAMRQFF